jgi:hypothetical protein
MAHNREESIMTFTVKIKCDNATFEEWEGEVARLLREIAGRLDHLDGRQSRIRYALHDINGNLVGDWKYR